jgi:hypothetical protein
MPAGWGPPHACPPRPGTGATRPAGRARVLARRSLAPRGQRKPCVLARGPVQSPAAIARPPRFASTPLCSDTLSAPPAGSPGARPLSGGARQCAAPPRRHTASCKPRAGRGTPRPPPAARPGPARSRARRACAPGGRSPAGSAWRARHGGRHPGGRPWRPHPFREPKRTDDRLGLGPCSRCRGCAAPAGGHAQRRAAPCPPGAGRRRLGVPLSRSGQATSPTATRKTP